MTPRSPTALDFSAAELTELVLTRAGRLLPLVPSRHAGGTPRAGLERLVGPALGGRPTDILTALRVLDLTGLLTIYHDNSGERLARSTVGDRVARAQRQGTPHALPLAVLQAGLLQEQVRALLALLTVDLSGSSCSGSLARRAAPQLVGVLASLPGATVGPTLRLDSDVTSELESAWSQWTIPPMAIPGSPEERQQIGDLAELYSLHLEMTAYLGASRDVLWVSRDDFQAGYDIEAGAASGPRRRIEVKGSRARAVSFVLSVNEWRTAQQHGAHYQIHFWGGVRLGADPAREYQRLREAGQPLVIANPARELSQVGWSMKPKDYRIRQL